MENRLGLDRKFVYILGTRCDSTAKIRVLRDIRLRLKKWGRKDIKTEKFYITTPNPEIVTEACRNLKLREAINNSAFAVPDGVGLAQASLFLNLPNSEFKLARYFLLPLEWAWVTLSTWFRPRKLSGSLNIIKGRELFGAIIALANKKAWRVVFLGDENGSAQKAKDSLERSYKKIRISAFSFPKLTDEGTARDSRGRAWEKQVVEAVGKIAPQMVFVGFGAPRQELWIKRNLALVNCAGMMAVGGTFDYLSGKAKLPPRIFSRLGLEWLWRLIRQPFRAKRIFTAFPMFPIRMILYKLRS